jgi:hypothetical protein
VASTSGSGHARHRLGRSLLGNGAGAEYQGGGGKNVQGAAEQVHRRLTSNLLNHRRARHHYFGKRSVYRDLWVRQAHLFDLRGDPIGAVHVGQGAYPHAVHEMATNGRIYDLHRSEICHA